MKLAVIRFHDAHAAAYDQAVDASPPGRRVRERLHAHLDGRFRPGDRVLDLNCGTGTDAIRMASRGVQVIGTDISAGMLAVADEKIRSAHLESSIRLVLLDTDAISSIEGRAFDGIVSAFNGLNHLQSLDRLASAAADLLRPGGHLICTLLNRVCLWEILYETLRLRPARMWKRITTRERTILGEAQPYAIRLYFPMQFARRFAAHFNVSAIEGFGILLPPAGLSPIERRSPATFKRLEYLEQKVARSFPWYDLCDQYLIDLVKRD